MGPGLGGDVSTTTLGGDATVVTGDHTAMYGESNHRTGGRPDARPGRRGHLVLLGGLLLVTYPIPSLLFERTAGGISRLDGVLLVLPLAVLLLASHAGGLPSTDGRITRFATVGLEVALAAMLLTTGAAVLGVTSTPILLAFLASFATVCVTSTVLGVQACLEVRTRSAGWALLAAWPLLTLLLLGVIVGTGVGTVVGAVVLPVGIAWTRLGYESVRRQAPPIDGADPTSTRSSN